MMAYESPLGNIVTTMTVNEPVPLVTLPPLMSPLAKKQRGEALASDLVSVPSSGSERLRLLPKLAAGLREHDSAAGEGEDPCLAWCPLTRAGW